LEQRKEENQEEEKKVETLGPKWFDLPATEMTPEVKQDLILLKNRKYLGPKTFYKSNDSKRLPKFFQMGTVVAGVGEQRKALTRRERKQHFLEEILDDSKFTVRVVLLFSLLTLRLDLHEEQIQ